MESLAFTCNIRSGTYKDQDCANNRSPICPLPWTLPGKKGHQQQVANLLFLPWALLGGEGHKQQVANVPPGTAQGRRGDIGDLLLVPLPP
eukprot:15355361-Alexandrium_andersonii.AAC.1